MGPAGTSYTIISEDAHQAQQLYLTPAISNDGDLDEDALPPLRFARRVTLVRSEAALAGVLGVGAAEAGLGVEAAGPAGAGQSKTQEAAGSVVAGVDDGTTGEKKRKKKKHKQKEEGASEVATNTMATNKPVKQKKGQKVGLLLCCSGEQIIRVCSTIRPVVISE